LGDGRGSPNNVYMLPSYRVGTSARLLVMLHGCAQTPASVQSKPQWSDLAEELVTVSDGAELVQWLNRPAEATGGAGCPIKLTGGSAGHHRRGPFGRLR
jgi:hypothetical protein